MSVPSARVVAITDAARGIGKATAKAFARGGARVAIGDLEAALAEQAAGEVGGDAIGLALDVTDKGSVEAFVARTERQLGPIDVFVNNAGIMPIGHFLNEDDATARRRRANDATFPGTLARPGPCRFFFPKLVSRGKS